MLFWNKKEVLVTFSFPDFNRAREILASGHIPYQWKTMPGCGGGRNRLMGTAFMDQSVLRQYYIYVHKKDYERAEYLIRKEFTADCQKRDYSDDCPKEAP